MNEMFIWEGLIGYDKSFQTGLTSLYVHINIHTTNSLPQPTQTPLTPPLPLPTFPTKSLPQTIHISTCPQNPLPSNVLLPPRLPRPHPPRRP